MEYKIRNIRESEYSLLNDFLYEAVFVPDGVEPPARNIIESPELQVYIAGFGFSKDDHGLIAEVGGKAAGAVWVRIMDDYGHIDEKVPSLAVSLFKEYRGYGIGTALIKHMLDLLRDKGYERTSLSVQKANYAAKMYLDLGYKIIKENDEEFIMVYSF